jgi:hypothetical protein
MGKIRALYTCPLKFSEKSLSQKRFFKAPNAPVADLMRLNTPASEAKEKFRIEPKYFDLSLSSTNPVPPTRKRDVSPAAYA